MVEVLQTREFSVWLSRLRDDNALVRIAARIRRMEKGNPGDARSVGSGVMEMRIDYGPGYRVYNVQRGAAVVILSCAGHKGTQTRDIKRAHAMAHEITETR